MENKPINELNEVYDYLSSDDELYHHGRKHLYRIERLSVIGKTIFANSIKKVITFSTTLRKDKICTLPSSFSI